MPDRLLSWRAARRLGLTLACCAGGLKAQSPNAQSPVAQSPNAQSPVALRRTAAPLATPAATAGAQTTAWRADSVKAPWWAPLASLAVPGSGQYALGQQRSVAYLVAEGFLIVQYFSALRDGNRERDTYRSIAAEVARQPFAGPKPLGTWDYYETMQQFLESGAYDRIPGGGVDPETDPSTYNGARWLLARETFWRDPDNAPPVGSPEYQRALAFYLQYAVTDEYRWSWRDAQLQQDVYRQTINSANRSYQRAVNYLGLVAVNHLASLVDAYVSVRVRRFGGVGGVAVGDVKTRYVLLGDPANGQGAWQAGVSLRRTH
ncbi:MAG: hypothetical protein K2Y26_05460 [Gemmatimonadaceae bacterium]|nr:hypothetical protein [Gemmatimonadaceae bacterium]